MSKEKKLTLIDDFGGILTVNKPIERIVTLNYRLPELFVVIGAKDIAGRCYLAKWFQPELFDDLYPEGILREYHEEFMGIKYRGIWAYPPK